MRDKDSIKKQNIEYPLKGDIFAVANMWCGFVD